MVAFHTNLGRRERGWLVDLDRLPATIDERSRALGVVMMLFGAVFGGAIASGRFHAGMLLLMLFVGAGAGLLVGGLYLFTRTVRTVISADSVSRSKLSIFGTTEWTEPLSGYAGVRHSSETRSTGGSSTYTVYLIRLEHDEKPKRVLLYESVSGEGIRGLWEEACRKLNLPAVEAVGGKMIKREVADLDKSVAELAAEGKLEVHFDRLALAPPGLEVMDDPDGTVITVRTKWRLLVWVPFLLAIAGVFIGVGLYLPHRPNIFVYLGLAFCGIIVLGGLWMLLTHPQLRITEDTVEYARIGPWGATGRKSIPKSEIEGVAVGMRGWDNSFQFVLVTSDADEIRLGAALSKKNKEYLRDLILSKVVC